MKNSLSEILDVGYQLDDHDDEFYDRPYRFGLEPADGPTDRLSQSQAKYTVVLL